MAIWEDIQSSLGNSKFIWHFASNNFSLIIYWHFGMQTGANYDFTVWRWLTHRDPALCAQGQDLEKCSGNASLVSFWAQHVAKGGCVSVFQSAADLLHHLHNQGRKKKLNNLDPTYDKIAPILPEWLQHAHHFLVCIFISSQSIGQAVFLFYLMKSL